MVLSDVGLDPASWAGALEAQGEPADLAALGDHLAKNYIPNTVIVDATASAAPPEHYLEWMKQGSREGGWWWWWWWWWGARDRGLTLSPSFAFQACTSSRPTRSSTPAPSPSTPRCARFNGNRISTFSTR
jgi:hypothetical protein